MRISSLFFLGVLGCGAATAGQGSEMDEARARRIAEAKGREAGYDLAVYRIQSIERIEEDPSKEAWRVFFEHAPPTPVGGHFTVYVDRATGDARLVHGK